MAVVLLLAGAVWIACDSGGSSTEPTEQEATIRVTVTADGAIRQGVTVRLFQTGASSALSTAQTSSSGVAEFGDLAAGSYEVEVDVPVGLTLAQGESSRKSVTVAAGATGSVTVGLVSEGDPDPDVVEIHLTSGDRFDPSSVTISPGTTVRWVNDTDTYHTITPDDHEEWERVELEEEGETFTHTFNETGTFDYFCEPHQSIGMTGSITVE